MKGVQKIGNTIILSLHNYSYVVTELSVFENYTMR